MSETLWKIALIPLKNYIDLTFHSSLRAPHPFKLSTMLSFSTKPLSVSLLASAHLISGSLWALAAESPVTFDDFKQDITLFRIPPNSRSPSKMVWRRSSELWLWIEWTHAVFFTYHLHLVFSLSLVSYLIVVWSTLPGRLLLSLAKGG